MDEKNSNGAGGHSCDCLRTPLRRARNSAYAHLQLVGLALIVVLAGGRPAGGALPDGDISQPQPLLALEQESSPDFATEAADSLGRSRGQRNPFAPSARLLMLKDQPNLAASMLAESQFVPTGKQPEQMPKMRLRGHLQGKDGEVLALLELVGGDVYIVREGDTLGLHDFGIDSVLRVQKISRLHLVVESGVLNKQIIVR